MREEKVVESDDAAGEGQLQEATQRRINWLSSRRAGERVLVIGTCAGRLPALIAGDGKAVRALEAEPERAAEAERRIASEPAEVRDRIHISTSEAGAAPDLGEGFDSVVLGELPQRADLAAVLAAARRALRDPEGVLLLAAPVGLGGDGAAPGTSLVPALRTLTESFAIERIEALPGHLGIVARPLSGDDEEGEAADWSAVVEAIEQQVTMAERRFAVDQEMVAGLRESLSKSREKLARSRRKLERAKDRATWLRERKSELLEQNAQVEREKLEVEHKLERLQGTRAVRLARRVNRVLPGSSGGGGGAASEPDHGAKPEPGVDSAPGAADEIDEPLAAGSSADAPAPQAPAPELPAEEPRPDEEEPDEDEEEPQDEEDAPDEEAPPPVADVPAAANLGLLFPPLEIPERPVTRPGLKVACIMDDFSKLAFEPEFEYIEFGPDDWQPILEASPPDLLLVESAWQGVDHRWKGRIARFGGRRGGNELADLVAWCRDREIPTVFWGKEDPPNFDRFIDTAVLFDFIFTTDEDSIPRYVERAGHDRVALLPFAMQPRIHNPAGSLWPRPLDVAFAGTYWRGRYPERMVQMETVLGPALDFGLHIFTRWATAEDRTAFPDPYAAHVVGSLPYESVLTAYRRYKVFLNVNSVPGSRTMCARRIFEILACGATVLSGSSPAIERLLGPGLVDESSSKTETEERLGLLLADEELRDRRAARALRTLLAGHTYGHRVDRVLAAIGRGVDASRPLVSVLCVIDSETDLEAALDNVSRQEYSPIELVLVERGDRSGDTTQARAAGTGVERAVTVSADAGTALGDCLNAAAAEASGDYLAIVEAASHYGAPYLTDLVNTFSYAGAGAAGKSAHYNPHGEVSGSQHAYVESLEPGTLVVSRALAERVPFASADRDDFGEAFAAECRRLGMRLYAGDRFNFVAGGAGAAPGDLARAEA